MIRNNVRAIDLSGVNGVSRAGVDPKKGVKINSGDGDTTSISIFMRDGSTVKIEDTNGDGKLDINDKFLKNDEEITDKDLKKQYLEGQELKRKNDAMKKDAASAFKLTSSAPPFKNHNKESCFNFKTSTGINCTANLKPKGFQYSVTVNYNGTNINFDVNESTADAVFAQLKIELGKQINENNDALKNKYRMSIDDDNQQ